MQERRRLPKWPFMLGDLHMIGFAAIVMHGAGPEPGAASYLLCGFSLLLGSLFAAFPYWLEFKRAHADEERGSEEYWSESVESLNQEVVRLRRRFEELSEKQGGLEIEFGAHIAKNMPPDQGGESDKPLPPMLDKALSQAKGSGPGARSLEKWLKP